MDIKCVSPIDTDRCLRVVKRLKRLARSVQGLPDEQTPALPSFTPLGDLLHRVPPEISTVKSKATPGSTTVLVKPEIVRQVTAGIEDEALKFLAWALNFLKQPNLEMSDRELGMMIRPKSDRGNDSKVTPFLGGISRPEVTVQIGKHLHTLKLLGRGVLSMRQSLADPSDPDNQGAGYFFWLGKPGHPRAAEMFSYKEPEKLRVKDFYISTKPYVDRPRKSRPSSGARAKAKA